MKHWHILVWLFILLYSCSKDKESEPVISVTPSSSSGWKNDEILLDIIISSDNPLTSLTISSNPEGIAWDTIFEPGSFNASFSVTITIPTNVNNGSQLSLLFNLADAVTSIDQSLVLNIQKNIRPVLEFSNLQTGFFNHGWYLFFSTLDGTVYNPSQASAVQEKIDFIFSIADGKVRVLSPDHENPDTSLGLQNWTTRKATRFVSSLVEQQIYFDMDDDTFFIDENLDYSDKRSPAANEGEVIAFLTQDNRQGLIRIHTIEAQYCEFSMKIQP